MLPAISHRGKPPPETLDSILGAMQHCLPRLPGGLASERISWTLRYHGLSSLVSGLVDMDARLGLQPELVGQVREDALAYLAQAMAWELEWTGLLTSQQQIPVLVLKGAALAHTLYPHPHWRMLGDLDLLIEPHQRKPFEEFLRQAGYVATLSTGGDLLFSEQQYVRAIGPDLQSRVDLHWALSNRPVLGAWSGWRDLWAGGVDIAQIGARGLGRRDALLQACVHRTGHHRRDGDRLIWLLDIHLLWTGLSSADQEQTAAAAQAKGLCALLLDGLQAASDWFGTDLETGFCRALKTAARGEPSARFLSDGPGIWQDLRVLDKWGERFRYLGQLLFPPRSYMQRRYGQAGPLPWLYLRRWWQGLRKTFRTRP